MFVEKGENLSLKIEDKCRWNFKYFVKAKSEDIFAPDFSYSFG